MLQLAKIAGRRELVKQIDVCLSSPARHSAARPRHGTGDSDAYVGNDALHGDVMRSAIGVGAQVATLATTSECRHYPGPVSGQ